MDLKARIDPARVPAHVAIIMDGNGRWATRQGEHRVVGHTSGVKAVRDTLVGATEIGIRHLTLYAFSTENWNRPQAEVDALMDLLVRTLMSEVDSLNENGVRLNAIGDLESLPGDCHAILQQAMARTAHNDRITLTLALSYSARWELVHMARRLAREVAEGRLRTEDIDEAAVAAHLTTAGMPDPELLIRTSGEQRVSNFLLWQIAYAELYFSSVLWPDFRKEDLFEAVLDYQSRERRFGLISEQVNPR
ncbi:MAG TPA: isoprenyl transferase [Flavobacteriales bacterium]|nr:isoprenyl transferase [Flavobacteriales bacterium]HQW85882.1 isoprenyl transferase [Flavobacteriales bacterium]